MSTIGTNADMVRNGIKLFNEGKIPELMELYDRDVEVKVTGTVIGGAFKGKEGLAEWFRRIGSTYPGGVHLDVGHLVESGDVVFAEWSVKGKLANGEQVEGTAVNVLEFREGKAVKHRYYDDSEQLARLMGKL